MAPYEKYSRKNYGVYIILLVITITEVPGRLELAYRM